MSKCPNCNASNIKIKKQGHLKFFQVPLSKKYISINSKASSKKQKKY